MIAVLSQGYLWFVFCLRLNETWRVLRNVFETTKLPGFVNKNHLRNLHNIDCVVTAIV